MANHYTKKANTNTKTKQESPTRLKNVKTTQHKNSTAKHNDTEQSATMETFPKSKYNEKWKQKKHKKIYKTRSKTAELPFANIKQNIHLTEFTTIRLKQVKY